MNYFEGFYVKCDGQENSVAFIFGKQISGQDKSAFIQIITDSKTYFAAFDYADYQKSKKGFGIKIVGNFCNEKELFISIKTNEFESLGRVEFGEFLPVKYDVMGPLKLLPAMECKHYTISMRHSTSGSIKIDEINYDFNNGVGYIEGDKGKSFPKKYFWSQFNLLPSTAIFVSSAIIPYIGMWFNGTVSVIIHEGKEYRLATYLGAKVKEFTSSKLIITQGKGLRKKLLEIWANNCNDHTLLAPQNGVMSRKIRESIKATVRYRFSVGGKQLFDLTSERAAYEFSNLAEGDNI